MAPSRQPPCFAADLKQTVGAYASMSASGPKLTFVGSSHTLQVADDPKWTQVERGASDTYIVRNPTSTVRSSPSAGPRTLYVQRGRYVRGFCRTHLTVKLRLELRSVSVATELPPPRRRRFPWRHRAPKSDAMSCGVVAAAGVREIQHHSAAIILWQAATLAHLHRSRRDKSSITRSNVSPLNNTIRNWTRPSRLRSSTHVEVTVRMAYEFWLSAVVEVRKLRVPCRPTAMVRQKHRNRFSLRNRDEKSLARRGREGRIFECDHRGA